MFSAGYDVIWYCYSRVTILSQGSSPATVHHNGDERLVDKLLVGFILDYYGFTLFVNLYPAFAKERFKCPAA
jgi:hypothetical protein